MNYSMKEPCDACPYRIGSGFTWESLQLHASGIFYCHKACIVDDDGEDSSGDFVPRDPHKTPQCAGALIFLEKQEKPNQAMRMAERFGFYDPTKLNMDAPVVSSPDQCRKPDKYERRRLYGNKKHRGHGAESNGERAKGRKRQAQKDNR